MLTHLKILLAASLAWLLSGCGTMYLAQAAGGQAGVLKARRPIDKIVADPATPAPLKARLIDVRSARDFAVTELHLPDNRSYRTYADIKRPNRSIGVSQLPAAWRTAVTSKRRKLASLPPGWRRKVST
jgi:predicted aminopeptidase